MKRILLICFALLNININAVVITKIINDSDTEVTFEFYESDEYLDRGDLIFDPKTKVIPRPGFVFPNNAESFDSLIKHEIPGSGRKSPGLVYLRNNVSDYLKIITKLGIFSLAQGFFAPNPNDPTLVDGFWKQQLGKTATKTMGKSFVNIVIVIDIKGEVQFFEDRD